MFFNCGIEKQINQPDDIWILIAALLFQFRILRCNRMVLLIKKGIQRRAKVGPLLSRNFIMHVCNLLCWATNQNSFKSKCLLIYPYANIMDINIQFVMQSKIFMRNKMQTWKLKCIILFLSIFDNVLNIWIYLRHCLHFSEN